MVQTVKKLAAAPLIALGLVVLSACAYLTTDGPIATVPSQLGTPGSAQPVSSQTSTTPPPLTTASPVATPTEGPSETAAAAVVMKDDGTGQVSLGMTLDAFHKKADALGWVCDPKTGANDSDGVTAGSVYVRFWGGKLFSLGVSDDSYQTEKGLKVGDSVDQLTTLYGTKFDKTNDSGNLTYYFTLKPKNNVLSVNIDQTTKTVTSWGLSIPGSGPNG